jgi:hypothetical protein
MTQSALAAYRLKLRRLSKAHETINFVGEVDVLLRSTEQDYVRIHNLAQINS